MAAKRVFRVVFVFLWVMGLVLLDAGDVWADCVSQCQAQLDSFCNADQACVAAMTQDKAKFPLKALYGGGTDGIDTWRCYSPSSLSPDQSQYTGGSEYCSRGLELSSLLAQCCGINTTFVTVFSNNEEGYPCIRIPSILLLGDNATLIAFAECRNWTGDGCLPQAKSQNSNRDICKKISVDGGKTWGNFSVVVRNACQNTPVWDANTKQIVLNFNQLNTSDNMQMFSSDNGETWSDPVSLAPFLGAEDGEDVGPGIGIQLSQSNKYAGRMLFIGHHGAYEHDLVWYSDDNGQTYQVSNNSATVMQNMDEAQLVELPNGNVLANMRNNHYNSTCDCRGVSISTDGGASFSPVAYDATLISPVCQATIIGGYNGEIYFANPASESARVNGTIRRSTDGCSSWDSSLLIWPGDYAYSCLSMHPDASVLGLLWETSSLDCVGPSCQIVFSVFDKSVFS